MGLDSIKQAVLGRPMSSGELEHTLLPKTIALPVFSSDPLSSVTYATQEILLVLGAAGVAALRLTVPVTIAVSTLLAIVVISYRQTVRAYPTGGGAYIVAHENLGQYPGLLAASALLIDYVLTVSVSVVAGVDAIISAAPSVERFQISLAVGFVVLVALANLRGVRESGTLFAIPTYGFVASIYLLIITGFVKCVGGCPLAESAGVDLHTEQALTAFLVLRAFAAGTTALTGVEAISDGVPAFRYPQSKNAATTLAIMGVFSISMFIGISWLATHMHVVFNEESERTVVAQIAHAAFGGGFMFYVVQVMSAAILVLAANTAFQDFPRLSSILANHRYMPRQFTNRGDRLVFSNGVVILSVLAILLIIIFKAELNRLIQLYLVGVFISFTFSQWGMVLRWRKVRTPGWRRSALINGVGGTVTGVVLLVVVATKFRHGAWIVLAGIPIMIFMMRSVHKHYVEVHEALGHPGRLPVDRRPGNQHMVIVVPKVDAAVARAVGYARSIRAKDLTAVTFEDLNHAPWKRLAPDIPLVTLRGRERDQDKVKAYLADRLEDLGHDDFLTVVIPEILKTKSLFEVLKHPTMHRLKASLLSVPGVQVMDIPLVADVIDPTIDQAHEPARNYAVVLVGDVHNAALTAIEYAETLRPTDIRGLCFGLDPARAEEVGNEWLAARIPHPLEIEDAPFRDLGLSLTSYLSQFRADGIDRVVTVVIPEFVVEKRRHQVLHNQTALIVKRRLLFERGVVVVSVPYHIKTKTTDK